MNKEKHYCNVKFSQQVIQDACEKLFANVSIKEEDKISNSYTVRFDNEKWEHDSESEFFADYNKKIKYAFFQKSYNYGSHTSTPGVEVWVAKEE